MSNGNAGNDGGGTLRAKESFDRDDARALRDLFEAQLTAMQERFLAELRAIREAVTVANAANDKRLDSVNEFRAQMADQAARFIVRSDLEAAVAPLRSDIAALKEFRAELKGKASQSSVNMAYAFAGLSAVLGIVNLLIALLK